MTGILPRSVVLVAFLFAFIILCLFSVLFIALCRRTPRTIRPSQHVSHDAESSTTVMGERSTGRASMYHERNLGHELPGPRHHRLPPLFSKRESQESIKGITPTASQPVIFGDEDQTCVVQVVVTPPTPARTAYN